ncbi:MAG TPA: imidazolonepropionase [Cyclobacteriaceae bacterium]|nr:imidazolonepropionase [Cyclobacteriaceae bacterium]
MKIIGPFKQILPLSGLPLKGALRDDQLHVIPNGGVAIDDGRVIHVDDFETLCKTLPDAVVEEVSGTHVLLPGFIDCHTHLCFAGNRSKDYALRTSGKSYLEIAQAGGGIWNSVMQTRNASDEELLKKLLSRVERHLREGVTTIEVKSGYGLGVEEELRHLRVIDTAKGLSKAELIATCLAAHVLPRDYNGTASQYLEHIAKELLPKLQKENLTHRVDCFVDEGAFNQHDAFSFLTEARAQGFDLTVHADQFTTGGSALAVKLGAHSADHLEASMDKEIRLLASSTTVAVALPGASLGLGMHYAPARKLLNAGVCLAIASDWNPGSAPMGDLLLQAAVLGASEKLSAAETFAALTSRAAAALHLSSLNGLSSGMLADMQAYPCTDYRDILYYQGKLKPQHVWKNGQLI